MIIFSGEISGITKLRDQDVVVVPIRNNSVFIDSAVYRPGIYESDLEESIFDIVQYAGGLKPESSNILSLGKFALKKNSINLPKQNIYLELKNLN